MKVLLVDDQAAFRNGLRDLLASVEGVEIVGEAADGREGIALARQLRPDITLMDVRMPHVNGIEATAAILADDPRACVLVLTTFDDDALIRDAMRAGATGYLLKGMPLEETIAVMRLALRGYATVAPSGQTAPPAAARLSERERQVWALIAQGCTNRDIAAQLFLTEGTVKNYVSTILATLGVRHRTEAALLWRTHG